MFRVWILTAVLVCVVVPFAQAKDVSMQQATYNNALQKLERSEAEYKADTQAVGDTEKLIEKKQKQLSEEKKKAELSKKIYMDAKESLERAQTALDNAWKN